jgi:hypothetical protein
MREPMGLRIVYKASSHLMTCVTKTMSDGWRFESKIFSKFLDEIPLRNVRPCDVCKLVNSLILRMACGLDVIPNECLRNNPKKHL